MDAPPCTSDRRATCRQGPPGDRRRHDTPPHRSVPAVPHRRLRRAPARRPAGPRGCSTGRTAAVEPAGPPPLATEAAAVPAAPGVADDEETGLDPTLLARFEEARAAAAEEGVELRLTSGRRTAEEQQELVDEAIATHGVPEAYRWVLPPEQSAHVQGLAIDVGPTEGAYWLAERSLDYGLCQTYANEVWHFELLPDGADACPEPHPDSSWGW